MTDNPLQSVDTIRKVALTIGCASLAIAAFMSAKFGYSMSTLHAALLGLLTLSGSIIFPYAGHLRSSGSKRATGYFLLGGLFLAAELFSHCGYTIGQRTLETEDTGIVNAAYETKQESAKRNAAQLAQYRADLEKLRSANPWAVSVSADGLRAQVAPKDEAIRQEERRGGCGPKCLNLKTEKAAIEDKIAVVEKDNAISTQIALLETEVNKREDMATTAEFKSSPVVAQTKFVSQIWSRSLDPDKASLTGTQIAIGMLLALVTTFLAPAMFSIAWGPLEMVPGASRKIVEATDKASEADADLLREMRELLANRSPAPVSDPSTHTKELMVVKEDDPRAKQAYDALSQLVEEARQLKAA